MNSSMSMAMSVSLELFSSHLVVVLRVTARAWDFDENAVLGCGNSCTSMSSRGASSDVLRFSSSLDPRPQMLHRQFTTNTVCNILPCKKHFWSKGICKNMEILRSFECSKDTPPTILVNVLLPSVHNQNQTLAINAKHMLSRKGIHDLTIAEISYGVLLELDLVWFH